MTFHRCEVKESGAVLYKMKEKSIRQENVITYHGCMYGHCLAGNPMEVVPILGNRVPATHTVFETQVVNPRL